MVEIWFNRLSVEYILSISTNNQKITDISIDFFEIVFPKYNLLCFIPFNFLNKINLKIEINKIDEKPKGIVPF